MIYRYACHTHADIFMSVLFSPERQTLAGKKRVAESSDSGSDSDRASPAKKVGIVSVQLKAALNFFFSVFIYHFRAFCEGCNAVNIFSS